MNDESLAIARIETRVQALAERWEKIEPLLLARSGDLQRIERIEHDLNGLGDKYRSSSDRIAVVEERQRERDRRLHAYIRSGDLFVRARGSRSARQLTRTAEEESAPVVLADGRIAFRRGDDLHAIDLESGLDSTLAELRLAKDPDEKPDRTGFLSAEQLRLFDVLAQRDRRKEEKREADRAYRTAGAWHSHLPKLLHLGSDPWDRDGGYCCR